MSLVLVDTDVCSYIFKNDSRGEVYRVELENHTKAIAFMTLAELYQWAYINNWGDRRIAYLEEWLQQFIILPFNNSMCVEWAKIRSTLRKQGRTISIQDAWIASCAIYYNCLLFTHNKKDYQDVPSLKFQSLDQLQG